MHFLSPEVGEPKYSIRVVPKPNEVLRSKPSSGPPRHLVTACIHILRMLSMCYHKRNRSTMSTELCRAHIYACIPALPTSTYTMNTCHAQMAAADRTNRLYLSYDKKFTSISSYAALCTASFTCPIHYQTGRRCRPNYAQSHCPTSRYYISPMQ